MERVRLERELAAGRSIESIARQLGRDPSTVAYWMQRYGLSSAHAERHRGRGGLARETLGALVEEGLTVRQIAAHVDRSVTTVRYWLRRHGLRTRAAVLREAPPPSLPRAAASGEVTRRCDTHGPSRFATDPSGRVWCVRCRSEAVSRRRRRVKAILAAEAGGRCALCGYDRYIGALQFHHVDPATKRFSLGTRGLARALTAAREEAAKCVLLCGNCHAEVEAGVATIPQKPPLSGG